MYIRARVRVAGGRMCVRQNLCIYSTYRMHTCACRYECFDRDTPGGECGGSMPSVTVTCFIVTHRGWVPKTPISPKTSFTDAP